MPHAATFHHTTSVHISTSASTGNNAEVHSPMSDAPGNDAEVSSPKDNTSGNELEVSYSLPDLPDIPAIDNPDKSQQLKTQEWATKPIVAQIALKFHPFSKSKPFGFNFTKRIRFINYILDSKLKPFGWNHAIGMKFISGTSP